MRPPRLDFYPAAERKKLVYAGIGSGQTTPPMLLSIPL